MRAFVIFYYLFRDFLFTFIHLYFISILIMIILSIQIVANFIITIFAFVLMIMGKNYATNFQLQHFFIALKILGHTSF